jgi:hypothetical protein
MKNEPNISKKLKTCDPEIKMYLEELKKENLNLHKQIAKFQVQFLSQQNEITALKKFQPKPPTVVIRKFGQDNLPPK